MTPVDLHLTEWEEDQPTQITPQTLQRIEAKAVEDRRMAAFMERNILELCDTFEQVAKAYIQWFNANSGEGTKTDFTSSNSPFKEWSLIDRANMGRFVVQDTEARFQHVAKLYAKLNTYFEQYEALFRTNLEFSLSPEIQAKMNEAGKRWSLMNDLGGQVYESTAQDLRAQLEAAWAEFNKVTPAQGLDVDVDTSQEENPAEVLAPIQSGLDSSALEA